MHSLGRFPHDGPPTMSYAEIFWIKSVWMGFQIIILFGVHANIVGPEQIFFFV